MANKLCTLAITDMGYLLWIFCDQGSFSLQSCCFISKRNPTVEITLSHNHLISTMGFPLLVRDLYQGPGFCFIVILCNATSLCDANACGAAMSMEKHRSLVPGRCGCNLKLIIFKRMSRTDILSISCEIALRWMPQELTYGKSTLVQVMAWCLQVWGAWE